MGKLLMILLIIPAVSFAQDLVSDSNYIFWSKDRRLMESDFQIKAAHVSSSYSFAQYSSDYNVKVTLGFGLPKDYKKQIRNYFIKSASWLDAAYDVTTSIKYQQTLFDLSEVYVRQFRKAVYENRKKLAWGKMKINQLNSQEVTGFSNRRVQYDITTNFGTIATKQKDWEMMISKELDDLKEFSAD